MPTFVKSRSFLVNVLTLAVAVLLAIGCKKATAPGGDTGAVNALDRASGSADTTPLKDIDVSKLSADQQTKFYRLVDSLTSPCGKGHSLRTSYNQDTTCKRAPFAVRFVVELLDDEASEDQVREAYVDRYQNASNAEQVQIDVSKAPHEGAGPDAPIRIVEFFDYACPHCQEAKTEFDTILQKYNGQVTEWFMMFPLGRWPDSKLAAQAALAADQQGKFMAMHTMLFANSPRHSHDNLTAYAASLGLDMPKFEADLTAAAAHVESDKAVGDGLNVESTPTIYINGKKYSGPVLARYLQLWIDEELAVNR